MKKHIFSRLLLGLSAVMLATSCTDYLDKAPKSDIDETEPYKNFRNFQGFIEELHNAIPMIIGQQYHTSWNFGEDEYWEPSDTRPMAYFVDNGNYRPFVDPGTFIYGFPVVDAGNVGSNNRLDGKANMWKFGWYSIRKANIGLANLGLLTDATAEEREIIEGELLFFRGWNHFMLMSYWGGLPYIDHVLPSGETPNLPRLNAQETARLAAADLEAAARLLPVDWDQTATGRPTIGNNNFRPNKIMALAYAGKSLLYGGSPLWNYESNGSRTYDAEMCKRGADLLGEALNLSETTGRYELAPFSQWNDLFYYADRGTRIPGLKEAILMQNNSDILSGSNWNQKNDYFCPLVVSSGVKVQPTANYMLYYGMKNGLPIPSWTEADPVSGYDPAHPWKDRDPRFYKDVAFDGVQVVKDEKGDVEAEVKYASLYSKGKHRTANALKSNLTGFIETKWIPQMAKTVAYYNEYDMCMSVSFMRLADVYLLYAEAVANGYGTPSSKAATFGMTAVEAVNKVRARAGVDGVNSRYTGSTDAFMSEVRRERAVELAFEGHRFHDLRRWLLLTERPYTYKTRLEFDRAAGMDFNNPKEARVVNLREEVILERKLDARHYWFPLPTADVNIYPEFGQNPGW